MEPARELIDATYADEVRRARLRSDDQKLMEPAELYDHAYSIMMMGIRA